MLVSAKNILLQYECSYLHQKNIKAVETKRNKCSAWTCLDFVS